MTTSTGTRELILDATWRLFNRDGGSGIPTVAAIAAEAGVSRQAVYLHFGNRATLLVETARRYDRASGFLQRIGATRQLEPVEALGAYIREWFAYIPEVMIVGRALLAAEAAGEEGGEAWRDRMGALRWGVELAVQRVADAGRLTDGWTVATASDWVWSRIHFTTWYHLAVERGWDREALADQTVRSVLAEVVRRDQV
jgi:AcrR family transcriptional regulator